jgi:periplasmic protein TonB
MESKKTPQADLEKKKSAFMQLGLIFAFAVVLFAFEWKQFDKKEIEITQRTGEFIEEEDIAITRQEAPPPPPPPPAPTTEIEIVDNDQEIDDDFKIDAEADQNTQVEEFNFTEVEETKEEVVEVEIFTIVEKMPEFPGGDEARIKFLGENIKYPQMAKESGIQGTVYVTFVVEGNGAISNVKVLRGIGGGCDEEAIRVVKIMPKWKSGEQRGKPVRVQFNMPIRFTLN